MLAAPLVSRPGGAEPVVGSAGGGGGLAGGEHYSLSPCFLAYSPPPPRAARIFVCLLLDTQLTALLQLSLPPANPKVPPVPGAH